MQKQQALAQTELQIEKGKSEFAINKMQQEAQINQRMMELKFMYDKQLKQMEVDAMAAKEQLIEDRKDKRTKLAGSQQSEMISQRQQDGPPINFDAKYSDLLSQ